MIITNEYIYNVLTKTFDIMDKIFIDQYVIMNKYDEVPYKLPSDLDIDVTQRDFERLDEIVTKISQYTGLVITQKIWHNYRKCAYILSPLRINKRFRIQLDFFSDFSVKSTPLLIPYQIIQSNTRKYGRFTVPSYSMEYVFLLMRRIFKNDFDREHCEIIANVLKNDIENIKFFSYAYFGEQNGELIAKFLLNNDIDSLQKLRPRLWKNLKKFSKHNSRGVYFIKYWTNQLFRHIYRIKYPVGMNIALLSPDGGGKSSIFNCLEESCWGTFHGIEKKYFRPRVFKNLGSYNLINPTKEDSDNPNPHGKEPDGLIKSFIRYFFYNLDFIFGYLYIKKLCIKKKLIVFDRYYYDYFVDIKRYKYSFPKWIPKAFAWSIPKPNIIFILSGDPQILYDRKKELPIEELKRQIVEYEALARKYKNTVIINVNKPLEEVTMDITEKILAEKALYTAKAMNIVLDNNYIPLNKN